MLRSDNLTLEHGGSCLCAVPAIHYTHVFAREVNRICHTPETRPDAIAVELGPYAAAAVSCWLEELGHCPGTTGRLPVMLGLLRRNRMIRASLRDRALRLQRETGQDLSELSADVLRRELNYCGYSVLYLTPVDSIIEAIRCGLELGIPVYGVDLEEFPGGIVRPLIIQTPELTKHGLSEYLSRNAPLAGHLHDPEVDDRRETAMAARVKRLMLSYRRVLFTCGIAHWTRVKDLLQGSSVEPSLPGTAPDGSRREFTRVVIHPALAVACTDLFPAIAARYEEMRKRHFENGWQHLDTGLLFQRVLRKACRKYFRVQGGSSRSVRQDLDRYRDFERYLTNLSLLTHRSTPDLYAAATAADEMMSEGFSQALAEAFMEFPWATPQEFPGCSVLSPATSSGVPHGAVMLSHNGEVQIPEFYVQQLPAQGDTPKAVRIRYEWQKNEEVVFGFSFGASHSWLPWDRLISALSVLAIRKASKKRTAKRPVSFEGSLLEGIDIKSTLREFSRGRERVFVSDSSFDREKSLNTIFSFPVVWIFRQEPSEGAEWSVLTESCWQMAKYAKDTERFKRIIEQRGDGMVATIAYGMRSFQGTTPECTVKCDLCDGIVIFQPICWTHRQFTRWAEATRFARAPFCNNTHLDAGSSSDLALLYKYRYRVKIGEFDKPTTLILMALPFAQEALTVVVPDRYKMNSVVHERARRQGVAIRTVPLSAFSAADIDRLSRCQLVSVLAHDPICVYAKEVEEAIGERQTDYSDRVPRELVEFGNDT